VERGGWQAKTLAIAGRDAEARQNSFAIRHFEQTTYADAGETRHERLRVTDHQLDDGGAVTRERQNLIYYPDYPGISEKR